METGRPIRPREASSKVRAPRIDMTGDVSVDSRTIGTKINYGLKTENLSRSGMLLSWESARKVPYLVNTIIELTIDPGQSWLDKPLNCLGKIVRRTDEESGSTMIGVQIVQMENKDQEAWEKCVASLEAKHGVGYGNAFRSFMKDAKSS